MGTYEGWSNKQTWAVNLWVSNDHGLYNEQTDMIRHAVRREIDSADFADEIEQWVSGMTPDLGASLWSDLMSLALGSVDWRELAESWLADGAES